MCDYNNQKTVNSISDLLDNQTQQSKQGTPLQNLFDKTSTSKPIDQDIDRIDPINPKEIPKPPTTTHHLVNLPHPVYSTSKVDLKRLAPRVNEANKTASNQASKAESPNPAVNSGPNLWCHHARLWTYNFLNHPTGYLCLVYHLTISLSLLVYLSLIIFTDRTTWYQTCQTFTKQHSIKTLFERILFGQFTIEFLIRVWCSRVQIAYNKHATLTGWLLAYFRRPSHIFDLVLVGAGVLTVGCFVPSNMPLDFTQDVYALITLRGFHRLYNVIQWTTVQSRHSPWSLLYEVIQDGGQLLFSMFYVCVVLVFICAYGLYLVENNLEEDKQATITNLMDSLYATSITLITVGYGDLSPVTKYGQALTGISIWIALAVFALPSGLIATSVALKVEQNEQRRNVRIRKALASIVIQRWWRLVRRNRHFQLMKHMDMVRKGLTPGHQAIKTNETFWHKIDHVLMNKQQYYAAQFIQNIMLVKARQQFRLFINGGDDQRAIRKWIKMVNVQQKDVVIGLQHAAYRVDSLYNHYHQQQQMDMIDVMINQLESFHKQLIAQNETLKQRISDISISTHL